MSTETYRERAPLLPPDTLAEIVLDDLLAPKLIEYEGSTSLIASNGGNYDE